MRWISWREVRLAVIHQLKADLEYTTASDATWGALAG